MLVLACKTPEFNFLNLDTNPQLSVKFMVTTECTKCFVTTCVAFTVLHAMFEIKFRNCSASQCTCIEMTPSDNRLRKQFWLWRRLCMLALSLLLVMNIVNDPHWNVRAVGLHVWRHGSECMLCAISRRHWLAGHIFCICEHFMLVANERRNSRFRAYQLQLTSVSSCKRTSMQCL